MIIEIDPDVEVAVLSEWLASKGIDVTEIPEDSKITVGPEGITYLRRIGLDLDNGDVA